MLNTNRIKTATKFVVLLGLVSLFADMTYEAARSINGPYLNVLGTSATTVGWVAGLGELLGYSLRMLSGYISDKTHKYWLITIIGYTVNLISVPLLAWAGYWQLAVVLMIMERIGKAIRTPARDAMLSYGTKEMGRGWGFGLHEALDQTGATIGPLLVGAVLFYKNSAYTSAFLVLFIPAIIALGVLMLARSLYPHPEHLEIKNTTIDTKGYSKRFWLYLLAVIFIAAGYADFPLIAYHFKKTALIKDALIPVFYSIAMISDGLAALLMGKLFDRIGVKVLMAATLISLCFAPMVFWGTMPWALAGMIVWGIGMGAQESVVKAVVADLIPQEKRGTAYGVFNTGFGIFWFIGSVLMGYLYDISLPALIWFSVITQLIAFIILGIFISSKFKKDKTTAFCD
ncbi:MFS transporter [Niastella vici]|uniref:MFS transporter n=2 Tax=Niastella vici TaxID=1703345 RepID=A0A1V9FPE5_9BACT|nr:MFS transporter [Niastella vici]